MPATLDAAQEYRLGRGLVGQRSRGAKHHPAVGDQHLITRIHSQQRRFRPSCGRRVDIGAQLIGAIGADARQHRNIPQLEIHVSLLAATRR
jgi:hypothetical protein